MRRERFESLVKSLAIGVSRRTLLRGLTGTVVSFTVSRGGAGAATCTPPGPRNFCNADSECCSTALCRNGACVCPAGTQRCGATCGPADRDCGSLVAGQRRCNGVCVNRLTDRQNCGTCGNVCRPGKTCSLGKCCPKGTINCNGVCKPKLDCPPVV